MPLQLGRLADLAGSLRLQVKQKLSSVDARKGFWDAVFESPAATKAMQGDLNGAVDEAQDMLNRTQEAGEIVLVGAGPGDPDLITLRGLRAIQSAGCADGRQTRTPGLAGICASRC